MNKYLALIIFSSAFVGFVAYATVKTTPTILADESKNTSIEIPKEITPEVEISQIIIPTPQKKSKAVSTSFAKQKVIKINNDVDSVIETEPIITIQPLQQLSAKKVSRHESEKQEEENDD